MIHRTDKPYRYPGDDWGEGWITDTKCAKCGKTVTISGSRRWTDSISESPRINEHIICDKCYEKHFGTD